jgi:hypothetical protein
MAELGREQGGNAIPPDGQSSISSLIVLTLALERTAKLSAIRSTE